MEGSLIFFCYEVNCIMKQWKPGLWDKRAIWHCYILIIIIIIIGEWKFQTVLESQHTYGQTNTFNRPDITFMNKKTRNTFLINIAVPDTHNLSKTITDKQNKYQEMANEICAMWKQKAAQVIPIVISSTGVIPKSLSQSLTRLNLHPNTYLQVQKSVILGTCSIVRNFLNYK